MSREEETNQWASTSRRAWRGAAPNARQQLAAGGRRRRRHRATRRPGRQRLPRVDITAGRVQSAADALVDCHRLAASSGFYYMVAVDQCTYAQQASQVRATILSIRWISRSTFILARAPIISPYRHGIDRSQADILRGPLVLKSEFFWVSHQQFD